MTRLSGANRGRISVVRAAGQAEAATARPTLGGWTSPLIWYQTEPAPQWNTFGSGLNDNWGPGTDDTIAYANEEAPARSAITWTSAQHQMGSAGSSPAGARASMAITDDLNLFEDLDIRGNRMFYLTTNDFSYEDLPAGGLWLLEYIADGVMITGQEYEYQQVTTTPPSDCAVALVDPASETSEVLCFWQDSSGSVFCRPVENPPEPRGQIALNHFQDDFATPAEATAMHLGDVSEIASGGRIADTAGWVGLGFFNDMFFSALKAVTLDDRRVLLLHLQSDGTVDAHIVTYEAGVVTVVATTEAITSGIVNLYQATSALYGLDGGTRGQIVFTARKSGTGVGRAVILSVDGTTVAVTATRELDTDYSHAGWCGDKVIILRKPGYNAGGSAVGWGSSAVTLDVCDLTLAVLSSVDASSFIASGVQQTVCVHGWANGRLLVYGASCIPADTEVGHSYEYDGSCVRLWNLAGDTLTPVDQWSEIPGISVCGIESYRLGADSAVLVGRTFETHGSPPGDEDTAFEVLFCGGAQKESNSDARMYRLSDNWLIHIEPEKNSEWYTREDLGPPVWLAAHAIRSPNSTYVRAIQVTDDGDIGIIGEPLWLGGLGNWWSAACRIDDTHMMIVHSNYADVQDGPDFDNLMGRNLMTIVELDPADGSLAIVATRPVPGEVGTEIVRGYVTGNPTAASAASGIPWTQTGPTSDGATISGTRVFCDAGAWDFSMSIAFSASFDATTTFTAYDADDNVIVSYSSGPFTTFTQASPTASWGVTHDGPFSVQVTMTGGGAQTFVSASRISVSPGLYTNFGAIEPTSEDGRRFVLLTIKIIQSWFGLLVVDDVRMQAVVFDLDDDWYGTVIDSATVDDAIDGPGFGERKGHTLVRLSDRKFVATFVFDVGAQHWSGHRGFIVGADGSITVGNTLQGVNSYGYQGAWMAQGCVISGDRYVYPVFDAFLTRPERFPNFLNANNQTVNQKAPYAVAVFHLSDNATLTAGFYPLRIRREQLSAEDTAFYEANQFFGDDQVWLNEPAPQHDANGLGYLLWTTDLGVAYPDPDGDSFWMFQGPPARPFSKQSDSLSWNGWMQMSHYDLDDANMDAVYVPGSTAHMANAWSLPYSHSDDLVVREGLFALITGLTFITRGNAQGFDTGYGTDVIRMFRATRARGTAQAGDSNLTLYRTAKNVTPER